MSTSTLPRHRPPTAGHRGSHRALLGTPADQEPAGRESLLDVVAVPVYRSPEGLRDAVAVADDAKALLLLLVSGPQPAEKVRARVTEFAPEVEVLTVDLQAYTPEPWLEPFLANRCPETAEIRAHDASVKRNVALLLAHQLGWERLLFLNDDVRGFDPVKVRRTAALLEIVSDDGSMRHDAAGWAFSRYPDNSVVCHAHRLAGGPQDTFVSDAALAVRVSPDLSFFPSVYNEDWLFLYDLVAHGRLGFAGDELLQVPYRPFTSVRRAESEEFGDVLAEGLFSLLHVGGVPDLAAATTPGFWREAVRLRAAFIRDILGRLDRMRAATPNAVPARRCLEAALARHAPNWPDALAAFVVKWRADRVAWQETLAALPRHGDRARALVHLGLESRSWSSVDGAAAEPLEPARR